MILRSHFTSCGGLYWRDFKKIREQSRRKGESKIKEALHIQLTPEEKSFNRDVELELSGFWVSMLHF